MITVITGVGAKGQVGEAVARALGARGDALVIVSRHEREVGERVEELRAGGCDVVGHACDLANASDVAKLAEAVASERGDRIDNLVNLAGGFALAGPVASSDPAAFERMLRINVLTAYATTRAFFPAIRRARGCVLFFASEAVIDGVAAKGLAGYVAAKAGVVALMRSVADEGREHGVRANALAPAAIRTRTNEDAMGADAPYVETHEVASVVAFLCSPAASAVTGQLIRLRGPARPRP